GLRGYLALEAHRPVAGVDEEPPHALREQVLRGAHRGRDRTARGTTLDGIGLRPGDRHHRIVLAALHRRRVGREPRHHLPEQKRLRLAREREPHAVDVGRPIDVAVGDAPQ
ncbi:MAG: hypothetical protein ACK56I_06980, partial [bacterium]